MSSFFKLGRFILPAFIVLLIGCGPATPPTPTVAAAPAVAAQSTAEPTATSQSTTEPAATVVTEVTVEPALKNEQPTAAVDDSATSETEPTEPLEERAYALGNPDAPITLIEYSDFQCPFCQRHFRETLPLLKETFIDTGRIRYEFRDYPIEGLHPFAHRLHEATYCVGDLAGSDAFWAAHDLLFSQPQLFQQNSVEATDSALVQQFVAADLPNPSDCLAAGTFAERVATNVTEGSARGVSGTPSFFINDFRLAGAQPFAAFAQAIEAAEQGTLAGNSSGSVAGAPTEDTAAEQEDSALKPIEFALNSDFALGDPDAPVKIIEFSDYQCPFCKRHAEETLPLLKPLIEEGRVYYEFRDFPIAEIHPLAYLMHEASLCVQQALGTDAYWLTHDAFFNRADTFQQSSEAGMNVAISAELSSLDLWTSDIETCYANATFRDNVAASVAEGQQLGLRGTPSFFVNGYLLVGALPFATFEQAIALAEQGRLAEALRPQAAAEPEPEPEASAPVDVMLFGDEPSKGDPDAPITIIEFSSYQCPFCKRHFDLTMPYIDPFIESGRVRYVFKDFPLPSQPQAFKAHEAAHCVHEQGGDEGYWAYHNLLFRNQAIWSRAALGEPHITQLKELAYELSFVDQAALNECLDSNKYEDRVRQDYEQGAQLNVRGTPSFFINGQFISGAQPFDVFRDAIEEAARSR